MELVDALDQTFGHAHTVIAGVRPDQYGDETPCAAWDVRELLAHMIGVVSHMAATTAGEPSPGPGGFELGADPAAQFRAAADAALAGWRRPGIMDGTITAVVEPMPGRVLAGINLLDTATHSWDLATATGQSAELPPAVAEAALEAGHQIVKAPIREGRFGPEIEPHPGCGPTDRLVAYLGRQP